MSGVEGLLNFFSDALTGSLLDKNSPVVQARRAECARCEHRITGAAGSRCALCHCWLAPKTRTASEKCPAGRW